MKYEDYEGMTAELTADNALETITAMLEKLKTDIMENDASVEASAQAYAELEQKYKELQVEYIKKFTSESSEAEPEETEEVDTIEEAIEAIIEAI